MPYRLTCPNGHELIVANVLAAGQVRCPLCQEAMGLRPEDAGGFAENPFDAERPRRRRLRDAIKLPAVSGWSTALVLCACFLVSGLAIPMTLKLPRWAAAEVVMGVWWLIWVGVLAHLLYTRTIVADDVKPHEPRGPVGYGVYSGSSGSWTDPGCWLAGDVGCLGALAVALLLPALVWVVIEVAIPFLALVIFGTIRGMLACVVNDRHQCRQHLGRSLGWAGLWATAYTAPPAALIWWIHWLAKTPAA